MLNHKELIDYFAKRFAEIKKQAATDRDEFWGALAVVESATKQAVRKELAENIEALKGDIKTLNDDVVALAAKLERAQPEEITMSLDANGFIEKVKFLNEQVKELTDLAEKRSLADLLINRDGELVATFSDGKTKTLGRVVGQDGMSFESFALNWHPDSQELEVVGRANGQQKSVMIDIPLLKNKGYWREGMKARALETYSLDGCLWIANEDTATRPGTDNKAWTLAARKGRDGKDARTAKSEPVKL